jgi:glycosyltransferase involved in cell wall biosynthesis
MPIDHRRSEENTPSIMVSIVIPCLNEAPCLPACLANALDALVMIRQRYGLSGEVVVVDNGSTDGSQNLAREHNGRVIEIAERGYGAALRGGIEAAHGQFIIMGDADGSYDFRDSVPMIEVLLEGADLCMGSRFKGAIAPGAMPWKNRYIGNPILTGILNILFRAGVSDAHCGLRAFRKDCFEQLHTTSTGMEFASEIVIKAALKKFRIAELPVKLQRDLRNRRPHLRPWRDGWRHLRFLLMLSPTWLFAIPALMLGGSSLLILSVATWGMLKGTNASFPIGNYWVVLAGSMLGISHIAALLAIAGHLYGVREGYRKQGNWTLRFSRWITLETMLILGLLALIIGSAILIGVAIFWSNSHFSPIANILPGVLGTSLIVLGSQNMLGGFLLAILNGNEAKFLNSAVKPAALHNDNEEKASA